MEAVFPLRVRAANRNEHSAFMLDDEWCAVCWRLMEDSTLRSGSGRLLHRLCRSERRSLRCFDVPQPPRETRGAELRRVERGFVMDGVSPSAGKRQTLGGFKRQE